MRDELDAEILDKKEWRSLAKARKREAKAEAKAARGNPERKRVYVLGFEGDVMASAVKRLGREIDAVLSVARPKTDEVVLRLQSSGGTVTGYGLAAAEISRLRDRKIKVTVSVDQVAASGGYMMACAADKIVAAPFALIGSIGVVAQAPNLHRLLKKNDIDYEELTAGEFKRTISMLGEITPAGREHFARQDRGYPRRLQELRRRAPARPPTSRSVATGDVWLASEALSLGLVDALVDRRRSHLRAQGRGAALRSRGRRRANRCCSSFSAGLGFEGLPRSRRSPRSGGCWAGFASVDREAGMAKYVGAIDQGTTSSRFIVFDRQGEIVAARPEGTCADLSEAGVGRARRRRKSGAIRRR